MDKKELFKKLDAIADVLGEEIGDAAPEINPDMNDEEIAYEHPVFWACRELCDILESMKYMSKKKAPYCKREWLNPEDSSSTDSIVAFFGKTKHLGRSGDSFEDMFLEIADCTGKVRLHKARLESNKCFIKKLHIIGRVVKEFSDHIELMDAMAEDD